jgi:hypothetical protein
MSIYGGVGRRYLQVSGYRRVKHEILTTVRHLSGEHGWKGAGGGDIEIYIGLCDE